MSGKFCVYTIIIFCMFFPLLTQSIAEETSYVHLARGIELFHEGRYEEAFDELSAQVEVNRYCALAYYYRSLIRVRNKEYRLADISLEAAFRDSSGFTDAIGLHAYILRARGNPDEALNEWSRFTEAVGFIEDEEITLESIMLPEEYRAKLDLIRSEPVAARIKAPKAAPDTVPLVSAEDMMPMSVVDYLERKEMSEPIVTVEEQLPEQVRFPLKQIIIILVPVACIILYFILKLRRATTSPVITITTVTANTSEVTVPDDPEEENTVLSDEEQEYEEVIPEAPFARTLLMKKERKKYAEEIDRLLKKI